MARNKLLMVLIALSLLPVAQGWSTQLAPGSREKLILSIRWCGVEGAPSINDPSLVGETSADGVLRARHERAADALYLPTARIAFQSRLSRSARYGATSFPIIRDPMGTGGDILSGDEAHEAVIQCQEAWQFGDPIYLDFDENGVVSRASDRLLSVADFLTNSIGLGHNGGSLKSLPAGIKFIDGDNDGTYDVGEHIYRDENLDGVVDRDDTLLSPAPLGTRAGFVDSRDLMAALSPATSKLKYLDLIREPADTYSIGSPRVQGITAVSVNDLDLPEIGFPVHGLALGLCGDAVVMDDPSFYLPPGPDYTIFETQLVAHEFGHAFCLSHGDGVDDDGNGILDDGDDPPAPFPGAGPGTICDSHNVMQYCWRDLGTAANPIMEWLGVGDPVFGLFTEAQIEVMRDHVLEISDTLVDPGPDP